MRFQQIQSWFLDMEPAEEFEDIIDGDNYRTVMADIGEDITEQDYLRALQFIQERPDASPGVVAGAVQNGSDMEAFNYMANQDTGESGFDPLDPVDWIGGAANKVNAAGDFLWEQVAKPVVRGAFTLFDTLAQEVVQRPVSAALVASGAGSDIDRDDYNFVEAYRAYGDSPGRRVFEDKTGLDPITGRVDDPETEGVDESSLLGTGFIPGGAAASDPQSQRDITLRGQEFNLGRLYADQTVGRFGADPGEAAYDWTAGITQFGIEVASDPINWLTAGTAGVARKGAGTAGRLLAARGGANLADEAAASGSAIMRFLKAPDLSQDAMRSINTGVFSPDRFYNVEGLAGRRRAAAQFSPGEEQLRIGVLSEKAGREWDELGALTPETRDELVEAIAGSPSLLNRAGQTLGLIDSPSGRAIDPTRVQRAFRHAPQSKFNPDMNMLDELAEADFVDVITAFGHSKAQQLDPTALNALAEAGSREEVLVILSDQIGQGLLRDRNIYGGLGSAVRRTLEKRSTWRKFYGTAAVGTLDAGNIPQSMAQLDTLIRQATANVGPDDLLSLNGRKITARQLRNEVLSEAAQVRPGDQLGLGEVASRTLNDIAEHLSDTLDVKVHDDFLGDLTKSQASIFDQMQIYDINDLEAPGGSPYNRQMRIYKSGGEGSEVITVPGAHMMAELKDFKITLPRSEDIRRAAIRSDFFRRLYSSNTWDTVADASRAITLTAFKPLALLRPAYIVRTQADDQLRMAAAGHASIAKAPTEFIQLVLSNRKGELGDLLGNNLRNARQANRIYSHSLIEQVNTNIPKARSRIYTSLDKPVVDDLADVSTDHLTAWRRMLAQSRNSPISNAMMTTGRTPEQMLDVLRGGLGTGEEALRAGDRRAVLDAVAQRMRNDEMFDTYNASGEVVPGRIRRLIDSDDNPLQEGFGPGDTAPIFDDLINEVADDLGMSRGSIERLFGDFEEDLPTRLSRELQGVLDDDQIGIVANEIGALNELTRGGTRWGRAKLSHEGRVPVGRSTQESAKGSGRVLQRGERRHLSDIATLNDNGNWVPHSQYKKGEVFQFRNRITRATDDPSVARDYSATDAFGDDGIPVGAQDEVEVIYKFDDDTRVTNLSWSGSDTSDVMIAQGQTFRVKKGAPSVLKRNKEGRRILEVQLQSVPEQSIQGLMANGRTPDWFYDLYRKEGWSGDLDDLANKIEDLINREQVENQINATTAARLQDRRISDPNRPTVSTKEEWVAAQDVDKIVAEQRRELEKMVEEIRTFKETGEIADDSVLYGMAQNSPVIDEDLYVPLDDLDAGDLPTDIKEYDRSPLRGAEVRSKSNTVRAYTRAGDVPGDVAVVRVRGGSQALRIGDGEYILPTTRVRLDRMAPTDGVGTRRSVSAQVTSQPHTNIMDPDVGGDNPLMDEIRDLARGGDLKAQQLLSNDAALLEHLRSIKRRNDYVTSGSDEVARLTYDPEVGPNFDDPAQDAATNEWLRQRYDAMPSKLKKEVVSEQDRLEFGRGRFSAFIDGYYEEIIGQPASRLSRLPTWQQAMVDDLIRQMPTMKNDALRRQVYNAARENLSITNTQQRKLLKAMDDAMGNEGIIDSIERSNELMKIHATREVEQILFDVSSRSAFQEAFDAWVPFADAWREGLEIWGRLVKNDPSIITGAFARGRGLIEGGAIRTNERGDRVFTVPGSTLLGNWVEARAQSSARRNTSNSLTGLPSLEGGLGAAAGGLIGQAVASRIPVGGALTRAVGGMLGAAVGSDPRAAGQAVGETVDQSLFGREQDDVNLRFESQLSGANLIFQSVGPGFGPVIQWPAGAFLSDNADLNGLRGLINPYGSNIDEPGDLANVPALVQELFPAYMKKFANAWTQGSVDQVQWHGAVADAMDALAMSRAPARDEDGNVIYGDDGEMEWEYKYDPANPVDVQRLTDDAERAARATLYVRGGVQGVSISGPSGQWQIRTGQPDDPADLIDPDYKPDFQWDPDEDPDGVFFDLSILQSEYYERLNSTNDPGKAWESFRNEFGVTPAYLASPRSKSSSPLPTDEEGASWVQSNPQVFTNYPLVAGYFSPVNEGDTFDYQVWRDQFTERGPDGRTIVTPEQRVVLGNQARARQKYYTLKDRLEPMPNQFKNSILATVKGILNEEYPGWEGAVAGIADATTDDRIEQFQRAIEDPTLEDNPLTEKLQRYFGLRAALLQQLKSQTGEANPGFGRQDAAQLRGLLQTAGQSLASESDEFRVAWRVLSREVEE